MRRRRKATETTMQSFLPAVAEQLFKDIKKTYDEAVQINPFVSYRLKFVFGSCALQALDLVDQRSVTCLTSPSGRKAFQVVGGSGRLYTCFLSCHYCPCPAFAYTVLCRNQGLLCKHILAVYLCQAMAVTQQESVSDQQMTALLSRTEAP
ncbi:zinc finger SWIM-type containing 7 [Nothobranchius furzeri]|uniref:Zinc finger SWIM-type containing 7 n=1 Tax=Nothobranchius furzeri TaxID=105023 RepID=A0A9D3BDQ3_NOTFU|nr:zinc finger SWIM-type containing 7 [Nothobranchius furzeri]